MIYCLYGDSHALDDKLKEIMKKLNVSDGSTMIKNQDKKSTKAGTKKEVKKIEDQTHSLVNNVTKIDINKDEKEAETMIRNVITNNNPKIPITKQQKSLVFKALTELKNHLKTSKGAISLKELRKKVDAKLVNNEQLGLAIKELDD